MKIIKEKNNISRNKKDFTNKDIPCNNVNDTKQIFL